MFYNYYQMLPSRALFLFFLLLFYIQITNSGTSPPVPMPDPTYQTGIYTLGNTPIQNSNTYTFPYTSPMSTTSLNASLAIAVMSF